MYKTSQSCLEDGWVKDEAVVQAIMQVVRPHFKIHEMDSATKNTLISCFILFLKRQEF